MRQHRQGRGETGQLIRVRPLLCARLTDVQVQASPQHPVEEVSWQDIGRLQGWTQHWRGQWGWWQEWSLLRGCRGEGAQEWPLLRGYRGGEAGVASAQGLQGGVRGGAQVQQSHKCRQRWVLAPEVEPAELEQRGEGWPRRGHRDIRDPTSRIQNSLCDPVGKDPPVSQVLRTYSDTGHKNGLAAS